MENDLPNNWTETPLAELLFTLESGSRPKGGVRGIQDGVPSVGGEHLNYDGGFDFTNIKYVPYQFAKGMTKGRIQIDDILVVKDGATTGKTSFVDEQFPHPTAVVNEHVFICRPSKGISAKYLFYFLFSDEGNKRILENFKGSAQGGINTTFINNIQIPLAPANEQTRIVAKLNAILTRVDNCKAKIEKIAALLKNFRQSVLAAAVSGELTRKWRIVNKNIQVAEDLLKSKKQEFKINPEFKELSDIPESWKWVALGNYAKCGRGRFSIRPRNDPKYFKGKYPFIQIGDLPRDGGFIKTHKQTLNEEGFKVSKMFPKNTVAIAIVGATIGNTGILSYDTCFTDSIVGIETGIDYSNFYVDYYLRVEKENFRLISYAGGGQPNIKLETINTYPFPLPPIEEQKEIVRKIEELFHFADSIEARYQKAKAWFDKLPQSILAKAFRGELVPQDKKDEPASVLLEKIKKKKQIINKSKTKQRKIYEGDDRLSLVAEI